MLGDLFPSTLTRQIGNPSVFQTPLILATYVGIRRVLASLQMCAEYAPATPTLEAMGHVHGPTAVCSRSVRPSLSPPTDSTG